jgi:hypothetical protein
MKPLVLLATAVILITGCNMNVKKAENGNGGKKVDISSSLGNLKVSTDNVDARNTGLTIYPGSRVKERTPNNEGQANVNIDTPWFGVKVVAVTFLTDDSPDKVWEFYKKDMSQYGRPLECRPGSPDLKVEKKNEDDLTCYDSDDKHGRHNRGVALSVDEHELKVGTNDKQRVVTVKPNGSGAEFSLVYVVTREGKEGI